VPRHAVVILVRYGVKAFAGFGVMTGSTFSVLLAVLLVLFIGMICSCKDHCCLLVNLVA
jgi:hypothetical protein